MNIIAIVLSAILGFSTAWAVQQHRIDQLKLETTHERISIQRAARATIERSVAQTAAAQSAAMARAVELRRVADGARAELGRLRNASDAAVRTATSNADACVERATSAAELLNQCAAEYQSLGERADRHVSDIKTLTDAWPK